VWRFMARHLTIRHRMMIETTRSIWGKAGQFP
jgi:hypothetical protein